MKTIFTILSFVVFLLAAWFVFMLECMAGISDFLAAQLLLGGIGVGLAATLILLGAHKALLLALGAYILLIVSFNFVDFSPVQPALRVIHDVHVGMNEEQVRAVVDHHFPENGRFKRPLLETSDGYLAFALDPDDGRYNAAIVDIRFSNGKVTGGAVSSRLSIER